MQEDISHIRQVCLDLIAKEKRKTVFEILEFYYPRATTLADFDVLGELALKAEHRNLYLDCAEAAYAVASTPDQLYRARTNLYKAYNALNFPEKALFYIELNLETTPDDFDTQMQRAFNLSLLGQRAQSEQIIEGFLAAGAESSEDIRYALSGKMLRQGKTAEGIINFIDTFKPRSVLFEDTLRMKKWTGGAQPGRTLYVNGEGGIGDEIINIRFFKHISDLGMRPILYSAWNMYRPDLVTLFQRLGHEVISEHYSIDTRELWTNMMPLPGYLGLTEDQLWPGSYISAQRSEKNQLSGNKFRIGIKCNGNPYFSQDVYRSIPLEQMLAAIPGHPNVEIYYFDKEKSHPDCVNLSDRLVTWEDTLDFVDQMDVILSSCTSLVHAAGALNKRTIVVVPIAEYYIWTSTRNNETTPWYDSETFTVLKQTRARSWQEPLLKASELLRGLIDNKI
jgi:hypothetical protein